MRRQGPVKWARVPGEPSIPRRSLRETENCLYERLIIFVNFKKFSLRPVRARRTVPIAESQLGVFGENSGFSEFLAASGEAWEPPRGGRGGYPYPSAKKAEKWAKKRVLAVLALNR